MHVNYDSYFSLYITDIKKEGRYRSFYELSKQADNFPYFKDDKGRLIASWSSNDYLGMSVNKEIIAALITSAKTHGVGSGGTRNIAGTYKEIIDLEKNIAILHNKESALIYSSGYAANHGSIIALGKLLPGLIAYSDQDNHASIISGLNDGKIIKKIFRHNDIAHLEELLLSDKKNQGPKIIIFESIYSTDGSIADVKKICDLAKKYNTLTYIDEVHAGGLYGPKGGGIANMLGLEKEINIIQANFGKAYGTVGGYIASSYNIIDAIRLCAPDFIFTTSLPPPLISASLKSMEIVAAGSQFRKHHQLQVKKLRQLMADNNLPLIKSSSHIIALLINNPFKAAELSKILFDDHEIYVQHLNYPTVPRGTERLRITVTPFHTDEMIDDFVKCLISCLRKLKII